MKTLTNPVKFLESALLAAAGLCLLITLLLTAQPIFAQERIEMQGTSITGNRELPKVLYIVPWKPPELISVKTPAIYSIIDQSLQPIERASFKRQLNYYNQAHRQ